MQDLSMIPVIKEALQKCASSNGLIVYESVDGEQLKNLNEAQNFLEIAQDLCSYQDNTIDQLENKLDKISSLISLVTKMLPYGAVEFFDAFNDLKNLP